MILPGAAAVVISAFTARRGGEVADLAPDCISRDDYGDPWLSVWIEKTIRRIDKIPIPESVVKVVETMLWLSASSDVSSKRPWLFAVRDFGSNVLSKFKINQAIKRLADFVKVPALPNGKFWNWRSHQFRYFFGVTYFWRFEYPSLTALSFFYRHFNPRMTLVYVTKAVKGELLKILADKESKRKRRESKKSRDESLQLAIEYAGARATDFEACRQSFLIQIAKEVLDGSNRLGGIGGERWNRELDAIKLEVMSNLQLQHSGSTEIDISSQIRAWVSGKTIDFHPDGHSNCISDGSMESLTESQCMIAKAKFEGTSVNEIIPEKQDFTHASFDACSGCAKQVLLKQNRAAWLVEKHEAEQLRDHGPTPTIRETARERLVQIEKKYVRSFTGAARDD